MATSQELITAYLQAKKSGLKMQSATVVEVEGSTYHRPGARMLVDENLKATGSISGGCLEKDLLRKMHWQFNDRSSRLISYDTRWLDEDAYTLPSGPLNTGCAGLVHVLVEPVADHYNFFDALSQQNDSTEGFAVASIYRSADQSDLTLGVQLIQPAQADIERLREEIDPMMQAHMEDFLNQALVNKKTQNYRIGFKNNTVDVLVEYINPPRNLVVFGAGNDVNPLVEQASLLGWQVTVVDQRVALANKTRFPRAHQIINDSDQQARLAILAQGNSDNAAWVLMTHDLARDATFLPCVQSHDAAYLGLLGPSSRFERLIGYWNSHNICVDPQLIDVIHSPVGLDIGANNENEIAIAIIADIITQYAARKGGTLKNKKIPLHPSSQIIQLGSSD